ncbi:MAG: aldolase catalytic domain-containing protein [Flavobacterium sp.]
MKILDCTLRDGGYYTNWDFDRSLVDNYFENTNKLPIDYLEVGYRSRPLKGYLGEYFYCPDYLLDYIRAKSTKKIVIILNEKEVLPEDVDFLLKPCVGKVDMVRIALDPARITQAIELATKIKNSFAFEVGFNVMYMSSWKSNPAFLEELTKLNGLVDYFYMVDSYGGVYPSDVIELISIVKSKTNVPLGFHGHNNLELGLINTLTALEHGVEIVDATITGMGRGAGNLKTELLLTALNANKNVAVDFNALSDVVDRFQELQRYYGWGTNLPYMVSGSNSLPQKDVMDWVSVGTISFNSIIRALQNQKAGIKDNEKFPILENQKQFKEVMVVGGGPSIPDHLQAIVHYLEIHPKTAIIHASAKNAMYFQNLKNPQFFCLVGNEGNRLEKVFNDLSDFKGMCVLPPFPRKMGTYVPEDVKPLTAELSSIDFTDKHKECHTSVALQTAFSLEADHIILAGYDGYQQMVMNEKEKELFNENQYVLAKAKEKVTIVSVVPTAYSVTLQSIYAMIL